MWLRRLEADRLRNLRSVALDLAPGLTVITGKNGHGKTSLLEAAYLLGTAHSFRTRTLDDLVARGGGPLRVSGLVSAIPGEVELGLVLDRGERRLLLNGGGLDLVDFLGRLDLVALPGDAVRTLRDGPEARRRFVDSGVAGLRPSFLGELARYRRTLAERNALLRQGARRATGRSAAEMEAWEERLAAAGARIHRRRREYVVGLTSRLGPAERVLFSEGGEVRARYLPSPLESERTDSGGFESAYREALGRVRKRDETLGFTSIGPHRDDLELTLDGADLRRFGSAGQLRAAMVALCAGKLGILRDERREAPLFLMDDFDSDFDDGRARALVDFLRNGGFQALLATSKDGWLDRLGCPLPVIRVEGGLARAA